MTRSVDFEAFAKRHRHPEIKDMTDFAYFAFGKSLIAYHLTAFMMLCNNIVLIGFHVREYSTVDDVPCDIY